MPTYRERDKQHQAQVRIKRKGVVVFYESATFASKKQAIIWATNLEKTKKAELLTVASGGITLSELMDLHKALLVKAEKDTRGVVHVFKTFKEDPKLADKPLLAITTPDIADFAMRHAEGREPATVLHALMVLRSAYTTAIAMHGIDANLNVVINATKQATRLGFAAKSQERDRRVTDDEIDLICKQHEALQGTMIPLRIICTLAVALPRRRGELLRMKWEDYTGGTLTLYDTKDPTGKRNETIPVPQEAQDIIDALPFTRKGVILPYNAKSVGDVFASMADLAGLGDIRFHDLRHEGISRLFAQGLDIPEVALISGHRSWATLKRYTHLKPADVLRKLNANIAKTQEDTAQPA
jgi:integrase